MPGRSLSARRGGALLAVMWLAAGLTAIALSVALTVRGEIRRSTNQMEGVRAHFLASGALDRALTYMLWGPGDTLPNGAPRYWRPPMPLIRLPSPGGEAVVEVIAETSRFNVNRVTTDELNRLLLALGLDVARASAVSAGILDWRAPVPGPGSPFDQTYLMSAPSFRAPHTSIEQIEELLSVQGVTPELFYGRYERQPDGSLAHLPGLRDCLSVYSSSQPFDLNTVPVPVMLAVGVPLTAAQTLAALRHASPILESALPMISDLLGPAMGRFRLGGERIYTLRATARPRLPDGRLSELRRTASMTVVLQPQYVTEGYRILNYSEGFPEVPTFQLWPQ